MLDSKHLKQALLSIAAPLTNKLMGDLEIYLSSAGLLGRDVGPVEPSNLTISLDLIIHNGKLTLLSSCSVEGRSICGSRTTRLDSLPHACEESSSQDQAIN